MSQEPFQGHDQQEDNEPKAGILAIIYDPPNMGGHDSMQEDTQPLPLGTGIHRRVSANALPGIDEIEALRKLKLISGTMIQVILDKQQKHDEQLRPIVKNLSEYIYPSHLMKSVDGIDAWQLELALLQLQWQYDTDINPNAQQTALSGAGLNNLACISALLGRYQNAQDCLQRAAGLENTIDSQHTHSIIEHNQDIIKVVRRARKRQDFWGQIGGSQ